MIRPVRDLVYIVPIFDHMSWSNVIDPVTKKTALIMPEQSQERCDQGVVKYIGPDVKHTKVGDYVIFPNYTGTLWDLEGEASVIIMMPEDALTAIVEQAPDIEIPGLFVEDAEGKFNPATLSIATKFLADAVSRDTTWHNTFNVKPPRRNKE